MSRILDTKEYLDTVCELLHQGQTSVAVPVTGGSMIPFLHNGDMVYLDLPTRPIKRGDIVLYTRAGGRYILHRVCRVKRDGTYLMVGDAQQELEVLPGREHIHAIVTSALHKGKMITPKSMYWRAYRYLWLPLRPFRHRLMGLK